DRVAEFLGHDLGGVGVDHVGDLLHYALLHQQADHVDRALSHAVGELLDGDGLGDHHLAGDLLLGLGLAVARHALHAAPIGGERAAALVVAGQRGGHRQAAAVAVLAGAGALGPRRLCRAGAGALDGAAWRLLVVALDDPAARTGDDGAGAARGL